MSMNVLIESEGLPRKTKFGEVSLEWVTTLALCRIPSCVTFLKILDGKFLKVALNFQQEKGENHKILVSAGRRSILRTNRKLPRDALRDY